MRHHRAQALAVVIPALNYFRHAVPAQMLERHDMQYMSKTDDKSTYFGLSHSEHHCLHAGTAQHIACFSDAVACTKVQILRYLIETSQRKTHKAYWVIMSMTLKDCPSTKV